MYELYKMMFWIVTTWLCVQPVLTDPVTMVKTVCSEYLVSGFNGVEDTALTASSSYQPVETYGPQNARLQLNGNGAGVSSSWISGSKDVNQHIQVKFPRTALVDRIILQGRHLTQWVKSFYVYYSMDGTTWSSVKSAGGSIRRFTGNSDSDTPVISNIVPHITARHVRINPQTWQDNIGIRFDVGGCYVIEETIGHSDFVQLPFEPTSESDPYQVFASRSSIPDCFKQCHRDLTCATIAYDAGRQSCRGFSSLVGTYGECSPQWTYFSKAITTSFGYKQDCNGIMIYKINEVGREQTNASDTCKYQHSRLMHVDSESKMEVLQNVIANSTILYQDYRFYVSGQYESAQWQYSDRPEVIMDTGALWSPSHPDPDQGHCIMLTEAGLASVNCTENMFFICGN